MCNCEACLRLRGRKLRWTRHEQWKHRLATLVKTCPTITYKKSLMKYLIIPVVLTSLTGCAGIQTPLGTYRFNATEATEVVAEAPKKKLTYRQKSGMSPAVGVLLGIGAAFILTGVGFSMAPDGPDHKGFALVSGGTGFLLWGVAGVVYLVEDER